MNKIRLLRILDNKTIFRLQDIERITGFGGKYAKVLMNRMIKGRLAKKIMRNAFTTKSNIWVIASNTIIPSYISFWSAASFLGYSEQEPSIITVATTRKIREINFEGYTIRFIPMKRYFFGYKKISSSEGEIFIAEDEKLLIDILLKPKECANPEEIESIITQMTLSREKIILYLKKIGSKSLIKRAGYLLEKIRGMDISGEFKIDSNNIILYPGMKTRPAKSVKWRII